MIKTLFCFSFRASESLRRSGGSRVAMGQLDDLAFGESLPLLEMFHQRGQIMARFGKQLRARFAHFLDNRVFHLSHFPTLKAHSSTTNCDMNSAANAARRNPTIASTA